MVCPLASLLGACGSGILFESSHLARADLIKMSGFNQNLIKRRFGLLQWKNKGKVKFDQFDQFDQGGLVAGWPILWCLEI